MNAKIPKFLLPLSLGLIVSIFSLARAATPDIPAEALPRLQNPMSVQYLKKHLRKAQPRLVLNDSIEANLRRKLASDPVVQNMYKAVALNAAAIQRQPLLERILEGRRLLAVSREMLYRMTCLGMTYRIDKAPKILDRINEELLAVCAFSDWNPSHYLDVAEMSLAVALALDWTAGDLPQATIDLATTALIEKGIQPSWPQNGKTPGWVNGSNNWNQVCNGAMIAASIAIAEIDPELAAKTIHRALEGLPHSLIAYSPDGVYPEGSTYWGYGTSFSVITAALCESAFGTDFGHLDYPAFKESAVFRALSNAPSGWYYNFADCGDQRGENGDVTLAWFAAKTGNKTFFERERFLRPAEEMSKLSRLDAAGLAWLAQYSPKTEAILPTAWKGEGDNPIVIFAAGEADPRRYYFGGKGGRGMVNHGNMDGGSFIFELDGVRWVIDPGNQSYHALEKTGFDLWGKEQESERWTLLTKNNFGHSTITVNDALHRTEGLVSLSDFQAVPRPEASFDLSPSLDGQVAKASRRFIKDGPASLTIEDEIELSEATQTITWQLMTQADVEIVAGGALLRQEGKALKLQNLSHPQLMVSVVSLDPAPLELDRQIEGLKRLEIRIPAWTVKGKQLKIVARLSGE